MNTEQSSENIFTYATSCLLGYRYFKEFYKMIAIDLSKQQAPDADPKAIQQIRFIGNLVRQAIIFFNIEGTKKKNNNNIKIK